MSRPKMVLRGCVVCGRQFLAKAHGPDSGGFCGPGCRKGALPPVMGRLGSRASEVASCAIVRSESGIPATVAFYDKRFKRIWP